VRPSVLFPMYCLKHVHYNFSLCCWLSSSTVANLTLVHPVMELGNMIQGERLNVTDDDDK
jgi:hypothetical protein